MINFTPFQRMFDRIESSKEDSDLAYFFDLLLLGEQLTKIIALFLVASVNDDQEKSRFRHEHSLVRANAVGDFAQVIDEVLTGPSAQLLSASIRDCELKDLTHRVSTGMWQHNAQSKLLECLKIFGIPHDPIANKVALKQWFQMFTVLRNKTRGHGATTAQPCNLACPKLFESIELIINNLYLFNRPCAYLHRNLSGKYKISFLMNKSSDFEFLKRETSHSYEDGIYFFVDKPRKLNLLHTTPELLDFYFPNGNFKDGTYETISYISDDRLSITNKEYINPVITLPASHTEGLPQLDVIGDVFTNLPRAVDEYITRSALEEELTKILLEVDRFPIITLMGRGGIGKTSLAINVITNISNLKRFDVVVWFSARDIDLLVEGPKQVKTKVLTQKDISLDYCKLIYPNKKIEDSITFFSEELTKSAHGKTLFVFDNFETLTNPIEVFEWLNTFIRHPNKILITSRMSRNFKADYPIEVRGMNELECKELIDNVASKFKITNLLTPAYIDDLINESEGHPYIIKILLGEVAKSNKLSKIQRIVADNDQILSALFRRTFNTLSPAAKRVFLTLSSWNSLVPLIAVESVLWRPENEKIDVTGAIEELQQSSFIELLEDDNDNNTFIHVPLSASLFGKSELEVYPAKLKIYEDRKLLMEFGAITPTAISNGVAARIDRKFAEVAKRISSEEELRGELPALEYISSRYPKAWLLLAQLFEEYDDFDSVKNYLREYLKSDTLESEKGRYWLKLADICKLTKDWEGESHALSEVALVPNVDYNTISECANRINNYFFYHPEAKQEETKKVLLLQMIEVMTKRITEANATDYSRLAWLYLNNGNQERAKEYAEHGLSLDSDNSHCLKLVRKISPTSFEE